MLDDGTFVESCFLDMRKVDTNLIEKSHEAECFIEYIAKTHPWPSVHYVEDKLSNFASGRTMLQTLMKLAAFNATCSYLIHQKFRDNEGGTEVKHLHPSTVKSVMRKQGLVVTKGGDKKALTLEWVSKAEPKFIVTLNKNDNPQPWCYDMADSYCVARAGYIL